MGRPPGRRRLDRHRHRRPARHRASRPADRLPARMRPQRRNCPGRSRPGPLPALDTPRTRPPSSRRRSGSRPVTPAIRSPAKPAHAIPPHAAEGNFAMPSPPTPQHDLPRVPRLLTLIHSSATVTLYEIRTLLLEGLWAGAAARWRALHELTVTAVLVARGGGAIARRYLN